MIRLFRALGHAARGLSVAFAGEPNLRLQVGAAVLVGFAAWLLGVGPIGIGLLAVAVALVLVAELLNSAIEALADAVHPEQSPEVGAAKDIAAGAVVVAATGAVVVGVAVLVGTLR